MEEFGGHPEDRPALYDTVYNAVHKSVLHAGPLQGALFWRYYALGQKAPRDEGGGAGHSAVTMSDPAWFLVMRFAADMAAAGGVREAGCEDAGPLALALKKCPAGYGGQETKGVRLLGCAEYSAEQCTRSSSIATTLPLYQPIPCTGLKALHAHRTWTNACAGC